MNPSILLIIALASAVASIICILGGVFILMRSKKRLLEAMKLRLFQIRVPHQASGHKEDEARKTPKEFIAIAEQLLSALVSVGRASAGWFGVREHITCEIVSMDKSIRFYVAIPERVVDLVTKQFQALYPEAEIEPAEEYNFFTKTSSILASSARLSGGFYLPIRTYTELESDPLNALTNALSKLSEHEGAAIQYIFRPAGPVWRKKSIAIARDLQQGKSLKEINQTGISKAAGTIGEIVGAGIREALPGGKKKKPENQLPMSAPKTLTPLDQETIKAIEEKASRAGFQVNLRVVVATPDANRSLELLDTIRASFSQYDHPAFNGIDFSAPTTRRADIGNYIFRYFDEKKEMIVNTQELASIWHIPNRFIETPYIEWLEARQAPAPTNLPKEGIRLGINAYRGEKREVFMKDADRLRHFYLIGKTGAGKTTLFENMVEQDIRSGHGVCVIDPHGEFAENVLSMIPKSRAEDVIIFDPSDLERPMGLNLLEAKTPSDADKVVSEMIAIFRKLFPPEMIGPIFEHQMRNIMLTLLDDPNEPATIAQIPRMFTDTAFQQAKVKNVKNPVVRDFWEKEMSKVSDFHKSETLGYLVSKVGQFVENSMMLNIVGQPSAFDIRDIMDNKKILLVKLAKGKIGDINADLLGMILVSKFQMAALSRGDLAPDQRPPFYLYLDEFQNFTTDSVGVILSEARKYGLALHMAHQFIAQLDDKIREAVFGNVGTMVSYRIGTKDAEFVAKEFEPVFSAYDLVNIDKYNAYVKLLIDQTPARPFNMTVDPPFAVRQTKTINKELAESIRELSRLKYGCDKSVVEAIVNRR